MAKHVCPSCGNCFQVEAKKSSSKDIQTKVIKGVTWYGWLTKYTDGQRMTYGTFAPSNKPKAKYIRNIMAARSAGLISPGVDWFPEYIKRANTIRPQIDAIPENAHREADYDDLKWEREVDNRAAA